MTYTREFNVMFPSGARPASACAAALRELKVDIRERMDDLLLGAGDWNNDPVVSAYNCYQLMHWSAFRRVDKMWDRAANTSAGDWEVAGLTTQYGVRTRGNSSPVLRAGLLLPRPCTLVDVSIFGHTTVNTSITGTVYKQDYSTSVVSRTSLASRTVAASTGQNIFSLSSGANINESIAANSLIQYTLEITLQNSNVGAAADFGFQGALVQYSRTILVNV